MGDASSVVAIVLAAIIATNFTRLIPRVTAGVLLLLPAAGGFLENSWAWVADHDMDAPLGNKVGGGSTGCMTCSMV